MQHVNFKYVDDETIVIIFAELSRFDKSASECATSQDIMMYILKNIGEMHNQPEWLRCDSYTRIFEVCEIAGFTEDKLITYEKDMYDERRLKGQYAAYRKMGYEAGSAEGRAEGRATERSEIITHLHSKGISPEQISEMLDIGLEEVQTILAKK